MSEQKDYSKLSIEELLAEEKKMKKNEITAAILIGFLFGIIIFGVASNGFGVIYTLLPLIMILAITKNSKKHKKNRQALSAAIAAKSSIVE